MKWLIGCMLALFFVVPAFAGEDPYIAVVGNDIAANGFYLSPKYEQFLYDENQLFAPPPAPNPERFNAQATLGQPEICDELGVAGGVVGNYAPPFTDDGNVNYRVDGSDSGWFEWIVRLPKKPTGALNLCIQCGVLKPDTFHFWGYGAINNCAAETGEIQGPGFCTRLEVNAGVNPLNTAALPTIYAEARAGVNNLQPGGQPNFAPFKLTAYRNPGTYDFAGPLVNGEATQILDGAAGTRILLKSCMDKCVIVKLPVTGQANNAGQAEYDLELGDLIYVRMNVPRANTVDIYCHSQSLRVMGIGISNF
jgi:hypothetical protein